MRKRIIHFLLLACLLFEMMEIEVIQDNLWHHVLDGIVVLAFGLVASKLSQKLWVGLVVLALGVIPWSIDLADLSFDALEFESILWGILHLVLSFVVGWRVFRAPRIGLFEICDAVSIFLLVGLSFAATYSVILGLNPGALHHTGVPVGDHIPYGIVLYYSFVTQLTVGYGDTVPASSATRFVSILQALFGVMYVATLIARFVSLHSSGQRADQSRS